MVIPKNEIRIIIDKYEGESTYNQNNNGVITDSKSNIDGRFVS